MEGLETMDDATLAVVLIVGIGISVGIAVGCANMAEKRGRSGGAWFLMGVLFGLFALLILVCLDTSNTTTSNTAVTAEEQANASINPTMKKNDINDLMKLKELLDAGIITKEEFDIKKKEILNIS